MPTISNCLVNISCHCHKHNGGSYVNGLSSAWFLSLSVEETVPCLSLPILPFVLRRNILIFSWSDCPASLREATCLNFGQEDANRSVIAVDSYSLFFLPSLRPVAGHDGWSSSRRLAQWEWGPVGAGGEVIDPREKLSTLETSKVSGNKAFEFCYIYIYNLCLYFCGEKCDSVVNKRLSA